MNKILPKDINIILDIPPMATEKDRVAIDSEWFGMDGDKLHRPHGDHACTTFTFDGKTVYVVTDVKDLEQAFDNIKAAVHIYANAKFDNGQFRRFIPYPQRKRLWDVILIDQIFYNGYFDDFTLKDLARRHLGIYLEKGERAEFETATEMTQEMLEYSCIDTVATWRVYQRQRKDILASDVGVWKNIELPMMWVTLACKGVKIDSTMWCDVAEKNEAIAAEIQSKYGRKETRTLKTGRVESKIVGLNLNAPAQVVEQLKKLGCVVSDSQDETLSTIKPDNPAYEFVQDLLNFRQASKYSSTYGKNWLDYIEADGRIHYDLLQMEAKTSRTSCRKPSVQNVPARDTKKFREMFVADEGNALIIADYSSQEPRIAAQLSGDEQLIGVFKSGKDIYVEVARIAFGETITKADKKRRNEIKNLTLGVFYGKTSYGLSAELGISKEAAQEMINKFFEAFPQVYEYIESNKKQVKKYNYVTTISGRKLWVSPYSTQSERNAANSPIQGSAGDMLKVAIYRFLREFCGDDFIADTPFVMEVHDEIVMEVPKERAEEAKNLLVKTMIEVAEEFHPSVPAAVEAFVGDNWSCKQ
jgi:DNA polymerase-1